MLLLSIESYRHIFFAQARLGKNGRSFNMYKFRKFPVTWEDDGPGVTVAFDSRMTKLGAFLERTKIDELPQLCKDLPSGFLPRSRASRNSFD